MLVKHRHIFIIIHIYGILLWNDFSRSNKKMNREVLPYLFFVSCFFNCKIENSTISVDWISAKSVERESLPYCTLCFSKNSPDCDSFGLQLPFFSRKRTLTTTVIFRRNPVLTWFVFGEGSSELWFADSYSVQDITSVFSPLASLRDDVFFLAFGQSLPFRHGLNFENNSQTNVFVH